MEESPNQTFVGQATAHAPTTFLSFDSRDIAEVQSFLATYEMLFPSVRSVGVTAGDELVRWNDPARKLAEIRASYVGDAQLTVVLVGERTWTRRFVDWEIAASALNGCGVLAMPLGAPGPTPARVRLLAESGRAIVLNELPAVDELRTWIATAIDAGMSQPGGREPQTPLMGRDASSASTVLSSARR